MEEEAVLLTYNTRREEFESIYERNKFYRGLFGYKQTVKKNGKKYEYEKDGLMDELPAARIDDSVFLVEREATGKLEEYFSQWGEKVNYHLFKVTVEDEELIDRIDESTQDRTEKR